MVMKSEFIVTAIKNPSRKSQLIPEINVSFLDLTFNNEPAL